MKLEKLLEMLKDDQYFCDSLNEIEAVSRKVDLSNEKAPIYLQRSVTQRIAEIRQPKGGYLPIKLFNEQRLFNDGFILGYKSSDDAKKFASSIGLVVDYISRYLQSKDLIQSFKISYLSILEYLTNPSYTTNQLSDNECISLYQDFKQKLHSIVNWNINLKTKNNIEIIKNIFTIVRLDAIYRAGYEKEELWERTESGVKLVLNKHYDIPNYIYDITLVCIYRTLKFYSILGNINFGECFGNGKLITSGDCDFISQDTIWDMKVSSVNIHKNPSTIKWTLQILIYYLMLKHPTHHNFSQYNNIKKVGIFNPFLNVCYTFDIENFINKEYIKEIEDEIIGFNWRPSDGYRLDVYKKDDLSILLLRVYAPNIKVYSRYNDKE